MYKKKYIHDCNSTICNNSPIILPRQTGVENWDADPEKFQHFRMAQV